MMKRDSTAATGMSSKLSGQKPATLESTKNHHHVHTGQLLAGFTTVYQQASSQPFRWQSPKTLDARGAGRRLLEQVAPGRHVAAPEAWQCKGEASSRARAWSLVVLPEEWLQGNRSRSPMEVIHRSSKCNRLGKRHCFLDQDQKAMESYR